MWEIEEEIVTMENAENTANDPEIEPKSDYVPSELIEPIWSVVTFETVAASGLTYAEAEKLANRLAVEKVSGICVITDDAAQRISS